MPQKKTGTEQPIDVPEQLPLDVIRKYIPSLILLACAPPNRRPPVDPCTPPCTQVKRSIVDLQIQNLQATGNCTPNPQIVAQSIVLQDWETGWIDEPSQKCSGNCKCGAEGDGLEVDRYPEVRRFDEDLLPACKLRFTATFTVVKRRRTGECRPV